VDADVAQLPVAGRSLDAWGTFDRLREAYFRYYNTPFGLADQRLQQERQALLDRDGGVFRYPLLELRPEYLTSERTLSESATAAGAPPELAAFAGAGLIPAGRQLYLHQEEALAAGCTPGRNMVITAGTGSGKTESFLLPILASLLEESRGWTGSPAPAQPGWWEHDSDPFTPQRDGESGREQAIRALVLYPMNALVDDQLTRLRHALDSDAARAWLDANRRGHRFYFGRYTGATPVTGSPSNPMAVRDLRRWLRSTSERGQRARALGQLPGREEAQYFVPRLDGAEMRSRWDMHEAPPDILITNYSMLNVMLLRERDGHFFDSTRRWLDEGDGRRRFTLVVDELHMYRGTAGTEVAYLLRTLKHRLGLDNHPDRMRVLAASASLEPTRDADYLQDFFGLPSATFAFIGGRTVQPARPRMGGSTDIADIMAQASPEAGASIARDRGLIDGLRAAFRADSDVEGEPDGEPHTLSRSIADLAQRVFPQTDPGPAEDALRRVLTGIVTDPQQSDPRLRAHLFFRNVPGLWACTDPACRHAPQDATGQARTVGKLHAEPTTRCSCGARVLELLYCQNCGDVLLGGFTPEGATQANRVDALLLADIPELAKLPDQVRLDRTAGNYLVYWPNPTQTLTEPDATSWSADSGKVSYEFRRSWLNPHEGSLTNTAQGHTGWSFHARVTARTRTGVLVRDPAALSPFPTVCPACGDDWEIRYGPNGSLPHTDPRRQRSPIRGMRTGFEKINQVLATELATDLSPGDRKVIVFTDSRQDAAKLSAGLGLRHYQDLLRGLLHTELQDQGNPAADVALAHDHIKNGTRSDASWAALHRLRARDASAFNRLRDIWEGAPGASASEEPALTEQLSRHATLVELSARVANRLLMLGVNPGGPKASLMEQRNGNTTTAWTALYDWNATPPTPRAGLSAVQQSMLSSIQESLEQEIIDGLFSGAGRDFESLGLGWLTLDTDTDPPDAGESTPRGHARASLRVLADRRRFSGLRNGSTTPPANLKRFWEDIDRGGGPTAAELQSATATQWGNTVREYIIDPRRVVLRPPGDKAWVCTACTRQHLTRGCGRCTHCHKPLPSLAIAPSGSDDFYAWKAASSDSRFRLNCAELTGQTDRLDAQSRQARFQGVFLDTAERELTDGVDLLSVTTTMEAGVDIGALSAVVLGNMPPTRFNYQQRVGRAGRRDTPVAVALTVCRGRSHDEYYFDRPHYITNEPTPRPYLALDRHEIYRRCLAAEVLRQAMADIGAHLTAQGQPLDMTANVHGAFGLVADWGQIRPALESWLANNQQCVADAAGALAALTPLAAVGPAEARSIAATLPTDIETVASDSAGHGDLSQRLAEAGVLPMFGFPSSVRYLHLSRPKNAYPWPPAKVIDRDLAMAVAQFAPLSELVRDGRIYPAIGITAFTPTRPTPTPVADPLGPARTVTTCRSCSYIDDSAALSPAAAPASCPRCGAGPESYRSLPLREPLGFRAGPAHDFDGNFAWTPRAIAARAYTDLTTLRRATTGTAIAFSGPGRRYIINDNAGHLFAFRPASPAAANWGGYVSVDAIERGFVNASAAVGDRVDVALGAIMPTDFLFLGPTVPVMPADGVRLNLLAAQRQPSGADEAIDGRRGAWYSLAFLLRKVAATFLDIQPLELTAGVYSGISSGQPAAYAFIADTLENGAGFSTHLGDPQVLPLLLNATAQYLGALEAPDHAAECGSSCYRCLRDYGNMAFHALLDWRLARDLFTVLDTGKLRADTGTEDQAIERWAHSYAARVLPGLPAAAALLDHPRIGTFAVVARHPLEASENGLIAPRLAQTAAIVTGQVPNLDGVVFLDTFTLDRDPRRAAAMCEQAAP
jgi:hypothetical protein